MERLTVEVVDFEWARGGERSSLFDYSGRKSCAAGCACRADGVPVDVLYGLSSVDRLPREWIRRLHPAIRALMLDPYGMPVPSDAGFRMIGLNDAAKMELAERRERIGRLGWMIGLDFVWHAS